MAFITQGKTNWKFILIIVILAIIAGGGTLWLAERQVFQYTQPSKIKLPEKAVKNPTGFCGTSTHGKCSSDTDCMAGGCSGEICQSKNEGEVMSPCIYKTCENAKTYGVRCGCVQNKCQWQ